MTHLWHWLIAAALLSATHSSGLAAEPLDGVYAAVAGELPAAYAQESRQDPPLSAHRYLGSDREDTGPASTGRIQGKEAGARLGWRDAVLASHAVQPLKRVEIGLGLSPDGMTNDSRRWYGVYLQSLDRVAERNTIYGLLRETPRPGLNDGKAPPALCCQGSDSVTSLEQFASTITAREVSPTFFVFGMLRKKGWNLNVADGWKLQAGVRHMQYDSAPRTKVGFLTIERYWDSFRTSYSYQLERSSGTRMAPSHVLQLDYLYSARDSIGVSFANGRTIADFGALGVLNTEIRNVAFRGQHWFKQDWALTFQAGYNNHGSLPAQKGARMGLRHSF